MFCCMQCVVGAVLNSGSDAIDITEDERKSAANNCFYGAAIYAGFVIVSLGCIFLPPLLKPHADGELQSLRNVAARGN